MGSRSLGKGSNTKDKESNKKVGEKVEKWSEDFLFTYFPQGFPPELNHGHYFFFRLCLNGFSFHRFSANAIGEQTPFNACRIAAVRYVAFLFGPLTPCSVSAKNKGVFRAPKLFASWRTKPSLRQHEHNHVLKQNFHGYRVFDYFIADREYYKSF